MFKQLTGREMASSKAGIGAHKTFYSGQGAVFCIEYTVHSLECPVIEIQDKREQSDQSLESLI